MIIERMFNLINSVKEYKNQMKKYTMQVKKYKVQVLAAIIPFILQTLFSETIVILFHEVIPTASL